jgi:uncharacterized protein YkwD
MRAIVVGIVVGLACLAVPVAGQAAVRVTYQASSEQQVLVLLNQIRTQNGLAPLSLSAPLRTAARAHSADMLQNGYFGHDSPNRPWSARVLSYLKSSLIGENIAWGQGSDGSAVGIVRQWMHSPAHRHTILTAGFHQVGLGLAKGTFNGTPGAVMATADFAA